MKNITYFYGGAFNPMTLTHINIIKSIIQEMNNTNKLIIGITEHEYKTFEFNYDLRYKIVFDNLIDICSNIKFQIIKQDERTWKFLNKHFPNENITLVMGQDEFDDLNNGKWHYHKNILNTYNIKVIPRTDGISATKVRELLYNNATNEELLKFISKITLNHIKNDKYKKC